MPVSDALPIAELPNVASEFAEVTGPSRAASLPTLTIVRPRCSPAPAGEIVVCAANPERNRLRPLPDVPEPGLPKASRPLGEGVVADIHNERAAVSGWPSNRIMVGVTFGF